MIEIIHENEFIRRTFVSFYNKNMETTVSTVIFCKGYTCIYGTKPVQIIMTQLDYGWAIIDFEKVKEIYYSYNETDIFMSYVIILDNGDWYTIDMDMSEKLKKEY